MAAMGKNKENLGQAGQNLLRVLIAFYFIGVSIGLIEGTRAVPLAAYFLAPEHAEKFASATVFVLAYLVLTGMWLRPAALLLAVIIFWSSYLENLQRAGVIDIGSFWRDITLIGALMLTYVQSSPRSARRRMMLRFGPRARRIRPADNVVPRRVVVQSKGSNPRPRLDLRPSNQPIPLRPVATGSEPPDNIFVDDAESGSVAS